MMEYPPGTDPTARHSDDASDRLARLEAQLETYKQSLTEIYELYDKKIDELSLVRRIGTSIRTPLDLEALCREIVDAVAREVAVDRLNLMVADPDRKTIRIRASYDASDDESRFYTGNDAKSVDLEGSQADRALRTGQPVLLTKAEPDIDPTAQPGDSPASLLFLPLVARHRTVGLFILRRSGGSAFNEDDVRILTIISDQAATALANVQLFNDLAAANLRLQESERQARQTSRRLERLLETANDVIFTLNESGIVTYVNRKAEEWGYSKEELLGRPFVELLESVDESVVIDFAREDLLAEVGIRTSDGQLRDALLSTSRIPDSPDSAFLVLARDVTGRKQLEKQLFHSEKLASIGILAAGVAHEIGNPLSAISGYTQILQSGGATGGETREYLEAIESQTARIQRIIEDLLNYSRPSAGLRSEIDLVEAIPRVLTMLTSQRTFRGLKIDYALDPDAPTVLMDPDHLAQLLVNIAMNAAQAMGGQGNLAVSLRMAGEKVEIELADDGPGIPKDIQPRIYDPFFTTKKTGQGTGLGLAICHRIVESYKGSIGVDSEPGRGTAVVLRFPATRQSRDKTGGLSE